MFLEQIRKRTDKCAQKIFHSMALSSICLSQIGKNRPNKNLSNRKRKNFGIERLLQNSAKAIEEHKKKNVLSESAFASIAEGVPDLQSLSSKTEGASLKFTHFIAEDKGKVRPSMEDAHFYKSTKNYLFMGVFDGHGGEFVADYASKAFRNRFLSHLRKAKGDVRKSFDTFFALVQEEVAKNDHWDRAGCTAIVCLVDKKLRHIYTATLGDSEANLYRQIEGKMVSIPLSCIRDWSHPKDAKRASLALNDPIIAFLWPMAKDPKQLRYPSAFFGVNVSRSIGDVYLSQEGNLAISHTPKVSINKVNKGDILVLCCDGLKDYVQEKTIVELVKSNATSGRDIAKALTDYAINDAKGDDNVTVIAVIIS